MLFSNANAERTAIRGEIGGAYLLQGVVFSTLPLGPQTQDVPRNDG